MLASVTTGKSNQEVNNEYSKKAKLLLLEVATFCETSKSSCKFDFSYTTITLDSKVQTGTVRKMSTEQPGQRLHPGIIASVIFVSLVAIIAAVLIIRKYCFPRSEASYRYSVLMRMENEGLDDTVGEESDEDLLE